MKKSLFPLILMVLIIALIFPACSKTINEPDSPTPSAKANLSKKRIEDIKWKLPKDALNVDTTYVATNDPDSGMVFPMAFLKGTRIIQYDQFADEYTPLEGKYIGVGTASPTYTNAVLFNTFGARLCVTSKGDWQTRKSEGYQPENIMLSLDEVKSYDLVQMFTFIQSLPKKADGISYEPTNFFIDEPFERGWTGAALCNIIYVIKQCIPSAKINFSEYRIYTNLISNGYAAEDRQLINWWPGHIFIMCDEYLGNQNGSVATYWRHTSELFAPFVYANWMSSVKNEGNYWSPWLNNRANSFSDLFATANEMGFNTIWLWVEYDPINNIYTEPYQMVDFGIRAWEKGWLKRALYHYSVRQICYNPDDPPEDQIWLDEAETHYCIANCSYAEYYN